MADCLVLNDTRKRARSDSRHFKEHQLCEEENNSNAMKCRFKTNKVSTVVKEIGQSVTMTEGRTKHKKLSSNPFNFQPSKKPEELRKQRSMCRKGGKLSNGNYCETHKKLIAEKKLTPATPWTRPDTVAQSPPCCLVTP